MDGRRRQWIKWDVFFNDGSLGVAMRDRFGVCGITVFQSFLSACKKGSVQGQISYGRDADALSIMGLPDLHLVNEKGEEWTLEEFWTFLGQRKQIRRRRRGRITDVLSTRWEQWQNTPPTQPPHTTKRRSDGGNADEKETDTGLENESENESEKERSSSADDEAIVSIIVEWKRLGSNVRNLHTWRRSVTASTRLELGARIRTALAEHADWLQSDIAALVAPDYEPTEHRIDRVGRGRRIA